MTPVRGQLNKPEHRRVLSALRAAGRMTMTGAHWLVLMTTEREIFGGPSSQRAGSLYETLEQVLVQQAAPAADQDAPGETAVG
ncbi:hypothetical protein [Streptomyces sp. CBMA152]|uniref:hypothetical protein n=1 Tax=Streptomyces sp. CBMA152 TaxID=1896312 RepID=UPI001660F827|nr:hypothetical protein [Streptomyces sp. CBMA152]